MQLDISKSKILANSMLDSPAVIKDITDVFNETLKDIEDDTCEMEKRLQTLVPKECNTDCYWRTRHSKRFMHTLKSWFEVL